MRSQRGELRVSQSLILSSTTKEYPPPPTFVSSLCGRRKSTHIKIEIKMSVVASKEFSRAVDCGDIIAVERALRGGGSPNSIHAESDRHFWPLLYAAVAVFFAILYLSFCFLYLLLTSVLSPFIWPSIWIWLRQRNQKDVVALLIERGADVDKVDSAGRTPLWAAAYVKLLIGFDLEIFFSDLNISSSFVALCFVCVERP